MSTNSRWRGSCNPLRVEIQVASRTLRRDASGQGVLHNMLKLREQQRGQGLVEYGLIIALVAVLAIAGLLIFGPAITGLLSKLGGSV